MSDFGDFQEGADKDQDEKEEDGKVFDPENLDFGFDRADFEGLKRAIWSSGVDVDEEAAEAARMTAMGGEGGHRGTGGTTRLSWTTRILPSWTK